MRTERLSSCAFKMVYLMSVFSDKIINKGKTVLPLRLLLNMFNLNFCFFFCNLICFLFENVSWGYLGGLDSLEDLGYWWKPAVTYYIFQYPFVKANRVCLALHSLRGKLVRWYLLAVQYSISVFYNKAYLPFITLFFVNMFLAYQWTVYENWCGIYTLQGRSNFYADDELQGKDILNISTVSIYRQ